MNIHKNAHKSLSAALLIAVLCVTGIGLDQHGGIVATEAKQIPRGSVHRSSAASPIERQAERLRARIVRSSMAAPSIDQLISALRERRDLLKHVVVATLQVPDGTALPPWNVSLARYPTWLTANMTLNRAAFQIDHATVEQYLRENPPPEITPPTNITVTAIVAPLEGVKDHLRVQTDGVAKSGYALDIGDASSRLADALRDGTQSITLSVAPLAGAVVNATDRDLGKLELLAVGRSNFAGSITGRVANVKKGLSERIHNVLIEPDETFSFNSTLGPVTSSAGWKEALGIFNRDELRPITGGGICQVATTVFRAMLNAGLPVVERREHSLFVHYYEAYGIGLDATVYPGHQDLVFRNDTGNYLLVQAYYDGFEATVNVYGTSDGRTVALDGPYFSLNAPAGLTVNSRPLRPSEIVWLRKVTAADGTIHTDQITSQYKSLPRSVVAKFAKPIEQDTAKTEDQDTTHAAAELSLAR